MKANEFVKKFGWDNAVSMIDFLENRSRNKSQDKIDMLNDLKRLVESHELVEKHGGLENAKDDEDMANGFGLGHKGLKQAIADVESCQ